MKRLAKVLLTPIFALLLVSPVLANSPSIVVSNQKLPVSAVNQNNRVLVPLRAIFEILDAQVDYDDKSKTITGNKDGNIIILKINDKKASIDGKEIFLDVPASIIDGRTLVPIRFIGESLGADVVWANNAVLVNSDESQIPATTLKPEKAFDIFMDKYPDSKLSKIQMDKELGKYVYKLEGYGKNKEYEVKIDAISGKILQADMERDDDADGIEIIRASVSKIQALVDGAMLKAGQGAVLEEWTLEIDDGIAKLEIEIDKKAFDDVEFTYNVVTGKLIDMDD